MRNPAWFGRRYPTRDDLEAYVRELRAGLGKTNLSDAYFLPDVLGVPVILMPDYRSNLEYCWFLAHEIGHLAKHHGNRGALLYSKDESQANLWAAQALIPSARIRKHMNASQDAMIAALSAHYEDIPLMPCPLRALAARIANHRLRALSGEVA